MAEHTIGSADSLLNDGDMKRLELEGKPVVITRVDGTYYAFGGNCPHYGAPLNEGLLKGHTLMCPWHHACFDVRTAVRLEPPALNDLARFPTHIKDGQVIVSLPNDNERQPQGGVDGSDERTFVIVGGGAAGNSAAEQLRRAGYRGKIIILSAVSDVPLDRPNLSKDYLSGKAKPEWMPLRDADWYAKRDIELRLDTRVSAVHPDKHSLLLETGESLNYDKLLLATGATPRQLKNTPGTDLNKVFLLREQGDADAIIQAAEGAKNAVIIGASFIALEVAASLAKGRDLSVTVIGIEAVPFERVFGAEIGKLFQKEHEANGVHFHLSSEVEQITGQDGQVESVLLKSGERLPADLVVIGVGVQPNTAYLQNAGLKLEAKDSSVRVNHHLQTSDVDIFASGDIARYETGADSERIEHWRVAQQHGIVAANVMLGGDDEVGAHVPFFWTEQWKLNVVYVGHATQWDEIIIRGNLDDKDFIAFYVAGGKLSAAAGSGRDREMDALEFILRDGPALSVEQMRDARYDLVKHALNS